MEIPGTLSNLSNDNDINDLLTKIKNKCIPDYVEISEEDWEDLIGFVKDYTSNFIKGSSNDNSENKDLWEQIYKKNKEILNISEELKRKEEEIILLKREKEGLVEELNKQKNTEQFTRECFDKRLLSTENENKELSSKLEEIRDHIFDLKESKSISEMERVRLANERDELLETTSNLESQVSGLKRKVSSYSVKYESLKTENKNLRLGLEAKEAEIQFLKNSEQNLLLQKSEKESELSSLSPEHFQVLKNECQALKKANRALESTLDRQRDEISEYHNDKQRLIDILVRVSRDLARFQLRLERYEAEERSTMHVPAKYEEDVKHFETDISPCSSVPMSHSNDDGSKEILDEIRRNFESRFGEMTDEKLCEYICHLIDDQTYEELRSQNDRLCGILENHCLFLQRFVTSGQVISSLLLPEKQVDPLFTYHGMKEQIISSLAKTRMFIEENRNNIDRNELDSLREFSEDQYDEYLSNFRIPGNLRHREEFAREAKEAFDSDVLRIYCDKLKTRHEYVLSKLSTCRDLLGADMLDETLIEQVSDKLRELKKFTQELDLMFHFSAESDDNDSFMGCKPTYKERMQKYKDPALAFLDHYITMSNQIIKQVDIDLREVLKFEGELRDIPFNACNMIKGLLETIENANRKSKETMNTQINTINAERASETQKQTSIIQALEQERDNLISNISDLKLSLESEQKENRKNEAMIDEFRRQEEEYKQVISRLESFNIALERERDGALEETRMTRQAADDKEEKFQRRFDELDKKYKENLEYEIGGYRNKLEELKEKHATEIEEVRKKYKKAKEQTKRIISEYDKAFNGQKQATAQLRKQNEELCQRLQSIKIAKSPSKMSSKTAAELSEKDTEIRALKEERSRLLNDIDNYKRRADSLSMFGEENLREELARKDKELRNLFTSELESLRQKREHFMERVSVSFSPFFISDEISGEGDVIKAAEELSKRLVKAENRYMDLKRRKDAKIVALSTPDDAERAQLANERLEEWNRWARNLYVSLTDGDVSCHNARSLRNCLGEQILASIQSRHIVSKLESLRAQKKALLSDKCSLFMNCDNNYEGGKITKVERIGTLIALVTSIFRVMRRSGIYLTDLSFSIGRIQELQR